MLLVVVISIALAMAAMAYSETDVSGPMGFAVVSTDEALLALDCNGVGRDEDGPCEVQTDGRLYLDFGVGLGPPEFITKVDVSATKMTDGKGEEQQYFAGTVTDAKGNTFPFETRRHKQGVSQFTSTLENPPYCFTYMYKSGPDWFNGRWCHPGAVEGGAGFQPGDTFTFPDLVRVTNNSTDNIVFIARLEGEWATPQSDIDISVTGPGNRDLLADYTPLLSGQHATMTFVFDVPDDWNPSGAVPDANGSYSFTGSVKVEAVAVGTP